MMKLPWIKSFVAVTALVAASVVALTFPLLASAQQVTYYDFDAPQANPASTSYTCPGENVAGSILFCFNDIAAAANSPNYLSDTFPPSIDPDGNPSHYAVQLTPAVGSQGSSLWFAVPQNVASGFTAYFAFKITPSAASSNTADGLAFVVQNSQINGGSSTQEDGTVCTATGVGANIVASVSGAGGCLGYGGIDNSLAVEFDTYRNGWDPDDLGASTKDNHVAIQSCPQGTPNSPDHTGACLVQLGQPAGATTGAINSAPTTLASGTPTPITFADGNVHQVVVSYSGPNEATPNLLQVFIDPAFNAGTHTPVAGSVSALSGTYSIPAALSLLNGTSAYVGFTSATGAAFEQHEIFAWTFTPHVTVTQAQPLNPPGTPTVFPFGGHTYAVTYPTNGPSTTGISMTVAANTISPALFSQLISTGAFVGSQCQVYDETGGNCIVYSASCTVTATGAPVQCPAIAAGDTVDFIGVKSAFNNSTPLPTPGFLQGDPFYSLLTSITAGGGTATVTCAGECSVTAGQTITVAGTSVAGLNGTVTVASLIASNQFTYATGAGTASATGGYITSTNVQNIFATFSPLTIDSTVTGKTKNFSDFIVTAVTSAATGLSLSAPSAAYGTTAPVTVTATSVNGIPTGIVSLVVDNNPALTSPLAANPANSASAATFNLSGLTAGTHQLSLTYPTTSYFLGNTATGSILITKATATPAVSAAPNPAAITTPVLVSLALANAQGSGVPSGTFSVSSNVSGDPSCNGSLAGGSGACSLSFLTPGARTLTINYPGDSNFGGLTTTVLETVNASPVASVSTNSLNFGTFYLGGIGLQSVTLTNTGDAVMTLKDPFLFDVGNGDSKEFIAVNLCQRSLAVGKSCSIYILFIAGPSYTPQTAILKIMDNAPGNPQAVNLLATVINPQASFSPSPLKFGSTPVGIKTTAPLTLKNTGATPLTITGISVGGANAGDFSQTNTCPAQLAAGASCSLTVSFVPAKTGTRAAAIVLTGNLQSGSQTLALSGTGK